MVTIGGTADLTVGVSGTGAFVLNVNNMTITDRRSSSAVVIFGSPKTLGRGGGGSAAVRGRDIRGSELLGESR